MNRLNLGILCFEILSDLYLLELCISCLDMYWIYKELNTILFLDNVLSWFCYNVITNLYFVLFFIIFISDSDRQKLNNQIK